MKYILPLFFITMLAGCSSPNPSPYATSSAYNQVKCGMSRQEVYALLGQPQSVDPKGDIEHCTSATWSIPHDSHGRGHWTISFSDDTVTGIANAYATLSFFR